MDQRLRLLLVNDNSSDAFEPLALIHGHFSIVKDDQLHESLNHSHSVVRLACDGVGRER